MTALAALAVSDDPDVAKKAIQKLRIAGPIGLDALFNVHAETIAKLHTPLGLTLEGENKRVRTALTAVSGQYDAHASHLYWYTDLNQAKRAAKASHKPILSLRLLGNLDEELSCANSRFFRTALYPNKKINETLKNRFILHWKSERPAPKVTIDFGDGRKLLRTVTGNSVHYVLDTDGNIVDAMPGMLAPTTFLLGLEEAEKVYAQTAPFSADEQRERRRAYHAEKRDLLASSWANLLGAPTAQPLMPQTNTVSAPPANVAAPTAVSKAAVEVPLVQAMVAPVVPLPSPADGAAWNTLLAIHLQNASLDAASRAFMRSKIALEIDNEGRVIGPLDDAAFERKVKTFEAAINEDSVRNEFGMHRVIHDWLAMTPASFDLEAFNQRIYASLFLTPRSDPWLGLLVKDVYSGIEHEGIEPRR